MFEDEQDKEFPVVNITFKDDSTLNHCAIFEDEPHKGMESLTNIISIKRKFQKLPWYSRFDGWVYFQNKYINGCFHVENVKDYEVVMVTKYNF